MSIWTGPCRESQLRMWFVFMWGNLGLWSPQVLRSRSLDLELHSFTRCRVCRAECWSGGPYMKSVLRTSAGLLHCVDASLQQLCLQLRSCFNFVRFPLVVLLHAGHRKTFCSPLKNNFAIAISTRGLLSCSRIFLWRSFWPCCVWPETVRIELPELVQKDCSVSWREVAQIKLQKRIFLDKGKFNSIPVWHFSLTGRDFICTCIIGRWIFACEVLRPLTTSAIMPFPYLVSTAAESCVRFFF